MPETLPSADELALLLRANSSGRDDARLRNAGQLIATDPAGAKLWLRQLACDRRRNVRGWAIETAYQTLGRAAVPILLERFNDSSLELRADVLAKVRALDPEALRSRLPALRRRLSRPLDHPLDYKVILWTVAQLRDYEAITDVQRFVEAATWPYYISLGRLVIDYIKRGPASVESAVRPDHDHTTTIPLCDLVFAVEATRPMRKTLERAAELDPEPTCREEYLMAASRITNQLANLRS